MSSIIQYYRVDTPLMLPSCFVDLPVRCRALLMRSFWLLAMAPACLPMHPLQNDCYRSMSIFRRNVNQRYYYALVWYQYILWKREFILAEKTKHDRGSRNKNNRKYGATTAVCQWGGMRGGNAAINTYSYKQYNAATYSYFVWTVQKWKMQLKKPRCPTPCAMMGA